MARTPIPPRAPIGDVFQGVLASYGGCDFLALQPQPGMTVLHMGVLIVRYGVRLLEKPRLSIVPGLLALDYGDILTGEEAWTFLLKKSNLYPRADVIGYMNDGKDEMLPIKRLDLALPLEPLVYVTQEATQPLGAPTALIAHDLELSAVAPRILEHLPRFHSLSAWHNHTYPDSDLSQPANPQPADPPTEESHE